jgi:hypothetical protein
MLRAAGAVAGGLIAWAVVATLVNLALRFGWADYAAVEKAMSFTLEMLLVRLALGAVASLSAGFVAARIAKHNGGAVKVTAALLLLMFIPVHHALWDRFPAWYHLTFLFSLVVMTLLGGFAYSGRVGRRRA